MNTGPGGTELPETSRFDEEFDNATLLYLPAADKRERLGVFYCRGTLDGTSTDILTITNAHDGTNIIFFPLSKSVLNSF